MYSESCVTAPTDGSYCSCLAPLILLPSVLVRVIPPLGSWAACAAAMGGGGDLRGSVAVVKENCRIVEAAAAGDVAAGSGGEGGRRRS